MQHQTVQPSIDKHRGTVSHQTNITKQPFSLNAQCHKDYFLSFFAFKVMHRMILLTRLCKLLTTVAIPSGSTCLKCLNGTTPLLIKKYIRIGLVTFEKDDARRS